MDFESTASASSATRARRKSYHKSVLIEGSARSFSSARMVFGTFLRKFPSFYGLECDAGS